MGMNPGDVPPPMGLPDAEDLLIDPHYWFDATRVDVPNRHVATNRIVRGLCRLLVDARRKLEDTERELKLYRGHSEAVDKALAAVRDGQAKP